MATPTSILGDRGEVRRILRFAAVGLLGTLLDVGLFTLLHVACGIPALAANTLSYSAGTVNNFALHRSWTYADRPRRGLAGQFVQFAVVSLSALALNDALVLWLAGPLGTLVAHPGQGAVLAKLCATVVGMVWNFLANNLWTFRGSSS